MVVPRTGMATILRALLSMPPLAMNDCLDNSKEWDPPHRTSPYHPHSIVSRFSSGGDLEWTMGSVPDCNDI